MKPVLIIQNHEIESPGTIGDYLSEHQIPFEIVHPWRGDKIPTGENHLAAIALGCPLSVNDTPNYEYLKHVYVFVADTVRHDRPSLGTRDGAQLLARVLGAKVERNPVKEIGTAPVRLTSDGQTDPIFAGFPAMFQAFHWHGETFRIPFGVKNLAQSDKCTNQTFRVGKAVGLQFHFEASAEKLPTWCEVYAPELAEIGIDARTITESFQAHADDIRRLNFRLLDNFFALT
jgi:GMP synthase-like glutamine amidotransferase